jgi:hypothetical protein
MSAVQIISGEIIIVHTITTEKISSEIIPAEMISTQRVWGDLLTWGWD